MSKHPCGWVIIRLWYSYSIIRKLIGSIFNTWFEPNHHTRGPVEHIGLFFCKVAWRTLKDVLDKIWFNIKFNNSRLILFKPDIYYDGILAWNGQWWVIQSGSIYKHRHNIISKGTDSSVIQHFMFQKLKYSCNFILQASKLYTEDFNNTDITFQITICLLRLWHVMVIVEIK